MACALARPVRRYHRAGSRGPWLVALFRLSSQMSDAGVAAILSDLSAAAIDVLEREGWTTERVEALRRAGASGRPWSRLMVWRYRNQLQRGEAVLPVAVAVALFGPKRAGSIPAR